MFLPQGLQVSQALFCPHLHRWVCSLCPIVTSARLPRMRLEKLASWLALLLLWTISVSTSIAKSMTESISMVSPPFRR